jgi:hypothetical protein
MPDFYAKLKKAIFTGIRKGWHTFIWVCKIVIPISLLLTFLQWTGLLDRLDFLMNPLMSLLHLPPEAALPILTGMLINLYAAIAAMTAIPFTVPQMTLMAIFCLIAHNLILEGAVQHKSGLNVVQATLFRIVAGIITVLIVSYFLGDTSQSIAAPVALATHAAILQVLKTWAIDTLFLLLKIMGIILGIMVLQECLKEMGWLEYIPRLFKWLMRILGLHEQTTLMWLAAVIFGLLYGSAVIMEESTKGNIPRSELGYLHMSVGINHALIEDPLLFAVLGLNLFWLFIPRFFVAIIGVQLYHLTRTVWSRIRGQEGSA